MFRLYNTQRSCSTCISDLQTASGHSNDQRPRLTKSKEQTDKYRRKISTLNTPYEIVTLQTLLANPYSTTSTIGLFHHCTHHSDVLPN